MLEIPISAFTLVTRCLLGIIKLFLEMSKMLFLDKFKGCGIS